MTPSSLLIVSVSGVRGIVGDSLTALDALRFARAFGGTLADPGPVLVSRDSRPSGALLAAVVLAGLMEVGRDAIDLGICPTPTVGVAVRGSHAAGAVQVTASHNPAPWNGLKLFGPDGAVLPPDAGQAVADRFCAGFAPLVPWTRLGRRPAGIDANAMHRAAVLACVDLVELRAAEFAVLVDGNGGAGGPLAISLLEELGCRVVAHQADPTGEFAHDPEPTPAHLSAVAPLVKQANAHAGFSLDPDADRLALIDETGACVSEELTLALAVQERLHRAKGPVVVNMSTTRTIQDLAEAAGCEFRRSAVGEANVVAAMRHHGALIGGEGNGGVIDPRVGWVRDPYIGMALILGAMARTGHPLSALVAALPRYSMDKVKLTLPREKLAAALDRLGAEWPGASADRLDGLRLDGPGWWLHVRASNTEPVVRIIAEARTDAELNALVRRAGEVVRG